MPLNREDHAQGLLSSQDGGGQMTNRHACMFQKFATTGHAVTALMARKLQRHANNTPAASSSRIMKDFMHRSICNLNPPSPFSWK